MDPDAEGQAEPAAVGAGDERAALLLEAEGPVRERVHALLESDGVRVCAVSDPELFQELLRAVAFDLLIVSGDLVEQLDPAALDKGGCPVALLVSAEEPARLSHLRVVAPSAAWVDRRLGDPGAFRALLGRPLEADLAPGDPVRDAFAPFGLSERQLEVLRLALLGEAPSEIGARLFISERTVRNHLHAIYTSVGVSGSRELLGRFVRVLVEATPKRERG